MAISNQLNSPGAIIPFGGIRFTVQGGGIQGSDGAALALPGVVGQIQSADRPGASGLTVATNVITVLASITLTPGTYLITGVVRSSFSDLGLIVSGWATTTSGTVPPTSQTTTIGVTTAGLTNIGVAIKPYFLRVPSSITVSLVGSSQFAAGTCTMFGSMDALRIY